MDTAKINSISGKMEEGSVVFSSGDFLSSERRAGYEIPVKVLWEIPTKEDEYYLYEVEYLPVGWDHFFTPDPPGFGVMADIWPK